MAYTTINKSKNYFNTVPFVGLGNNRSIDGVGFQPDLVWFKSRSNADDHNLFDAVRGVTKCIETNTNIAEFTQSNGLGAFNSDGFTVGNFNAGNRNNGNIVSWNWKANGAGSSDSSGSAPTATVSANTTAGFSIVKYTTGSVGAGMTVPHGLGVKPDVIIFKKLNATGNPTMYHKDAGGYLYINTNAAVTANTTWVTTTNSLVTLANSWELYNDASSTYVMYCFAEKQGYSKFGSYIGNNNVDGTFVYTGFKPAFVLQKDSANERDWTMIDNKRSTTNVMNKRLVPNVSNIEVENNLTDFLSNGFKNRGNQTNTNNAGSKYIYMAFAEAPLVGTNNVPCTAR